MSIVLNGTTGITTPDINTTAQATDITTTGDISAVDLTASGGVYLGGSAAANKLDDYEEGTWTPTCPTTLTTAAGTYVKIGGIVFFSIQIYVTSNSNTANFTLSLPFTASADSSKRAGGWFSYTNGGSANPGNTTWMVNNGTNTLYAYITNGANRECSNFAASYWIGGQYRTD